MNSRANTVGTYVVIGASNAGRLCAAPYGTGAKVMQVVIPSWKPTTCTVERAVADLNNILEEGPVELIVFQMLDSAAFYART